MEPNISPCKGCADRHTACHDQCAKYAQWKAEHQKSEAQKKEYKKQLREDWLRSEQCEAAKHNYVKSKSGKNFRRV